jgi:hypothetical protein
MPTFQAVLGSAPGCQRDAPIIVRAMIVCVGIVGGQYQYNEANINKLFFATGTAWVVAAE